MALLGVDRVRVTPLELAVAYRWLALELAAHSDSDAAQVVRAGLEDSASFGMAGQASLGGVAVLGKTGTAEGASSSRTHGWFVGLAPADNPQVVIAVFLPAGRGADAAHLAGQSPGQRANQRISEAAMNRQSWSRCALSLVAAAAVVLSGVQPAPPVAVLAAAAPSDPRTTLRIGMWTLWHDHDVTLTPTGPKEFTLLETCERCPAEVLHAPAKIHAEKDGLNFSTVGKTLSSSEIRLSGPITLTAHGETVTLHDPVAITARAGVLVIVVTLPVENYVERVVASESGPGDSPESLKALAIVVRSFALHEAHGHAELRSVRFHALPASALERERRSPRRCACGHAGDCGRDSLVPRATRPRLLRQGLRRAHGFSRRDLAARQTTSLSAFAA